MTKSLKLIHVAVAVIEKNNQIFIAKRHQHLHQGGLWEFPGGKVEPGESVNQALVREIQEEIGICINQQSPLIQIVHHYPEKSVLLDVWRVTEYSGEPFGKESQDTQWVDKVELSSFQFPDANKPIINAIQLPQHYLITPEPKMDKLDEFIEQFTQSVSQNISLAQLRAKKLTNEQLQNLYHQVLPIAQKNNVELFVNCNLDTAAALNIPHVHLSGKELWATQKVPAHIQIAASCHNTEDIERAAKLGARFIVLSCVKATNSHPNIIPMGWKTFAELCLLSRTPVYALGGMNLDDTETAIANGAQGIAGISCFWQVTG